MIRSGQVKLRDPSEPEGMKHLAYRRTNALVLWYGNCITSMDITQLAASCYLQGAEDAITVCIKDEKPMATTPGLVHKPSRENLQ